MSFDVTAVRNDFPILHTLVGKKELVYLDNAATTQKPQSVIDTIDHFYSTSNANIHRGVHYLAELATEEYEESRRVVGRFLNAKSENEIVFVKGTTEGINLIAHSFGKRYIHAGDEILISTMEHHANIVPWQLLCESTGALLKIIPVSDTGELDMVAFTQLLSDRTRLVSVVHASNSLGTINPVKTIVEKAHAAGAKVLLDGAQAVGHFPVDVQDLDCDFYVFSGHKLFGPTGIGAIYGKYDLLETLPPYQGGGDMISKVTFEKTTFKEPPGRFEAGTPHISGAIALAASIRYLEGLDRSALLAHEHELLEYGTKLLSRCEGITLIGTAKNKVSILSFTMEGSHPHDIATILDSDGIAIRAGHHCTQPLLQRFGVSATARASFAFYNTKNEIDKLVESLKKIQVLFA
ncbi:MAG: cysteine desulfurase [Verrucomicrobia bacterium]|nr:cysteine desulfurase [Verrucomicrobiota bacterium]MDA1066539.1 cysteine desulfurase [Verrucomicrobiota bacterium]